MREEIRYRWRIQWVGRWTTTQHHTNEHQIRLDHPEATCLEHTRLVQMVPESEQEVDAALQTNFTSGFMRGK
jgi:hypothetical protein